MIKFSKEKVLLLHQLMAEATGGSVGVRDPGIVSITQPQLRGGITPETGGRRGTEAGRQGKKYILSEEMRCLLTDGS